jgi:hypothetical protein
MSTDIHAGPKDSAVHHGNSYAAQVQNFFSSEGVSASYDQPIKDTACSIALILTDQDFEYNIMVTDLTKQRLGKVSINYPIKSKMLPIKLFTYSYQWIVFILDRQNWSQADIRLFHSQIQSDLVIEITEERNIHHLTFANKVNGQALKIPSEEFIEQWTDDECYCSSEHKKVDFIDSMRSILPTSIIKGRFAIVGQYHNLTTISCFLQWYFAEVSPDNDPPKGIKYKLRIAADITQNIEQITIILDLVTRKGDTLIISIKKGSTILELISPHCVFADIYVQWLWHKQNKKDFIIQNFVLEEVKFVSCTNVDESDKPTNPLLNSVWNSISRYNLERILFKIIGSPW